MILKRYGTTVQSVEINFDARAMTEVGFRRDRQFSIPSAEFDSQYELVDSLELKSKADGDVQDEAERALLAGLEAQLRDLDARLPEGEVLLIENEQGVDYPKTVDEKKNVIVEGQNRLHFYWQIEPPLRLGRYRKRS
jgi:hypothetical protein